MKITQWVPAHEFPRWRVIQGWMDSRLSQNLPDGCNEIPLVRSRPIGDEKMREWNEVVETFLKSDSEWLWSTHLDVVVDPGTLKRLLSWNKPFVSALVFMKQSPVIPHVWTDYDPERKFINRIDDTYEWFMNYLDWIRGGAYLIEPKPEDALIEVGFTSTSCTLVHRSVLEKIEKPWFVQHGFNSGGEDFNFFEKARKAGFKGYVDRSCICEHLNIDQGPSSLDFMMWYWNSTYKNTGQPSETSTGQQNVISSAS